MLTCWVDPRTGIVLGLDDGRGLRCGLGEGVAVQVPLPGNKYVQSIEDGIVPKTDMIGKRGWKRREGRFRATNAPSPSHPSPTTPSTGHLKFQISAYNASKYAPTQTIECGTAAKTLWGEAGQGAAVDSLIFNAERYVNALNKSATGSKNWTAANNLVFSGAHLAATQVSDCLTDRFAAPLVNASALATKNPLLAKVAGDVVSKLKDPVKVRERVGTDWKRRWRKASKRSIVHPNPPHTPTRRSTPPSTPKRWTPSTRRARARRRFSVSPWAPSPSPTRAAKFRSRATGLCLSWTACRTNR